MGQTIGVTKKSDKWQKSLKAEGKCSWTENIRYVEGKISINVGRGDKQLEFQLFPSKHSLKGENGDEDGLETEVMSVIRNKWII